MSSKKHFHAPKLTVTELSRTLFETNQKLNDANIRLLKANELLISNEEERIRFYANISHDLRAPITAISNFTEYLLAQFHTDSAGKPATDLTAEDLYHMLGMIAQRTSDLQYLIQNFFLLSTLEKPDASIHKEPVNVGFFLEDYFYMCEADPDFAAATLSLDLPEDFEITRMLDPNLMHNVLDNLFSNARKYSGDKPEITLGAVVQPSPQGDILMIYVADRGIGIAPENIEHIFEPSFREDSARTPGGVSGNGLGLSIVRTIVELHNASIRCDSKPGEGSRFTITFPPVCFCG